VLARAPASIDHVAFTAFIASGDLYWVLDDVQQQLLLRLTPSAFDDNRYTWGLTLAQIHALRGDPARARAYADSARSALEKQLRDTPKDAETPLRHNPLKV
jgi:hypothetical protein